MLFNSYPFIFAFLPIVLIIYHLLRIYAGIKTAFGWLILASLFFYGWWDISYVPILLFSVIINYQLSRQILAANSARTKTLLLTAGICGNLALLCYFKYTIFAVSILNDVTGSSFSVSKLALPLGISFFTFQQIIYLLDISRGVVSVREFSRYLLFVAFFPHLIAGPILHHQEMMPQFADTPRQHAHWRNLAIGCSIFILGLAKKVLFADNLSDFVGPVHNAAAAGIPIAFFEGWMASICYALQLYFDFSGYSDMAIGLARMFGIILPLNFNSPYKAKNIAMFWQSWHMTLTRLLYDYVYGPLATWLTRISISGGYDLISRFILALAIPTVITFFLSGLWHGAGWTFVIFGLLHAMYMVIYLAWREYRKRSRAATGGSLVGRIAAQSLTLLCVVVAFVFFRAHSVEGAIAILKGMAGINKISLPVSLLAYVPSLSGVLNNAGIELMGFSPNDLVGLNPTSVTLMLGLITICLALPNTQQIFSRYRPALRPGTARWTPYRPSPGWQALTWRPSIAWGLGLGLIGLACSACLSAVSEFLYFQF